MKKEEKGLRKLQVTKRTLRPLQSNDLLKVAGGDTITTPTSKSSDRCCNNGSHVRT